MKKVYRFFDKDSGYALADVIALENEVIDKDEYEIFDEKCPWKKKLLTNYEVREMLHPIFIGGKQVYKVRSIKERKEYCLKQLTTIYEEVRRLSNPSKYYVDLSEKLWTFFFLLK